MAPPLEDGDERHGADRQRVVDEHVEHRDQRHQHPIAEKIEVEHREVHRSPLEAPILQKITGVRNGTTDRDSVARTEPPFEIETVGWSRRGLLTAR
jgi:hypothetical protein